MSNGLVGEEVSAYSERVRFFVAGVPKAGTTALCRFLGQHPQIFMCPIKEPSFFAARDLLSVEVQSLRDSIKAKVSAVDEWFRNEGTSPPGDGLALSWEPYEALFDEARDESAIGEGSVAYWWALGAPAAIRERFPDARFVLILRDPADRFFSQYLATRWTSPLRTLKDCTHLALDRQGEWGAVLDLGNYATHLRRFFECFEKTHFSIHLYDDFSTRPRTVCREIFRFLGVDQGCNVDVSLRANEPNLPRLPVIHALRLSIGRPLGLPAWLPRPWQASLRRLYHGRRSHEVMSPADRRVLRDHYRDEILQTAELIGRDLSPWLR